MILEGFASSGFGFSVSATGDANNDGYNDVLVGAPGGNSFRIRGKAYLYFGGPVMDNTPDVIYSGPSPQYDFGSNVSFAGKLNNDNFSDIIIGSPTENSNKGIAYVYYGGVTIDTAYPVILTGTGGLFGSCVSSAGDVNNDNFDDVMVSAPEYDNSTGRVYIYYGGNPFNNVADDSLSGSAPFSDFGLSLSYGDVDNNSYSDLLIGSIKNFSPGEATLYYNFSGKVKKTITFTGITFHLVCKN